MSLAKSICYHLDCLQQCQQQIQLFKRKFDNSLSPSIKWYEDSNFCLIFKRNCLKQKKKKKKKKKKNATFTPANRINLFIVYDLDTWSRDLNSNFTLKDCFFGGVKFAENAHPEKYVYSSYVIGFDSRSEFSFHDKNCHYFWS